MKLKLHFQFPLLIGDRSVINIKCKKKFLRNEFNMEDDLITNNNMEHDTAIFFLFFFLPLFIPL